MTTGPIRVLVVDDDPDMRATLGEFIPTLGAQAVTAGEVEDARKLLSSGEHPFDLVLTDLVLPDGSGLDVLQAAHRRSLDSLVTIITGYASLETAIAAIRTGAYDYLTKPFTLDEIGVQIRNMMGRVHLSRENARLSARLQNLCQQIERLQRKRSESDHFEEDVKQGLRENSCKLDALLAGMRGDRPEAAHPEDRRFTVETLLWEAENLQQRRQNDELSDEQYAAERQSLVSRFIADI